MHPLLRSLNREIKRASETEEERLDIVKSCLEALMEAVLSRYHYLDRLLEKSGPGTEISIEIHFKQHPSWILRIYQSVTQKNTLSLIHDEDPTMEVTLLTEEGPHIENIKKYLPELRELVEDTVLFLDSQIH